MSEIIHHCLSELFHHFSAEGCTGMSEQLDRTRPTTVIRRNKVVRICRFISDIYTLFSASSAENTPAHQHRTCQVMEYRDKKVMDYRESYNFGAIRCLEI